MRKIFYLIGLFLMVAGLAIGQQKSTKTQKKTTTATKVKAKTSEAKSTASAVKDSLTFEYKEVKKDTLRNVKVKGFVPPEFPGGKDKMNEFLSQNMKYPEEARTDKVEGDVFVRFMVKKDGTITTPKVISGLGAGCDQEAVRLLTVMPKWNPGKKDDEPVDMPYTMYIHFVLN
ncbi:energy transducer TonB [Cytophagaceae bacterium YF14B1]|uniref:Energy transducer TonB n=1 Tax=Xanthocytophaga flava TaxID=3048013 RepID=A0AAE3UAE0_9BACT|nr:energy transducer TonB [Xanthocytophaga flavus]MDJ1472992.1 energy transducer TonB [Xanthocytophaga flavus]MDJ1485461.1 energy transducer TonB [Xanthocytophaga flavus]